MGAYPLRSRCPRRRPVKTSSLDFALPIPLFQSQDDLFVPPAGSREFARAAPGPVTHVPVAAAGHIESWNVDPTAYEGDLRTFLKPFSPAG